MIKRAAEVPVNVVSKMKDGVGDVTLHHFLDEQQSRGAGRLFAKMVLPPGNSIGLHTHEGDMEAYYLLKGTALLNDNGTEVELSAGDCHVCPDGSSHSILNIGEENLEYIAVILYTKQKEL